MFKSIILSISILLTIALLPACSSSDDGASAAKEYCKCLKIKEDARKLNDPAALEEATKKSQECIEEWTKKHEEVMKDSLFNVEFSKAIQNCGKAEETKE